MALELQRILNNPAAQVFDNLTTFVDLSSAAVNMFIVSPDTKEREAYIFDTRGEESIDVEGDITDNWIEDNTTMQDHIGLKPETITLRGYVGELSNKPKDTLLPENVRSKIDSATGIGGLFAPSLTTQTKYLLNRAEEVYNIYKKANRSIDRIESKMADLVMPAGSNNQCTVFGKIYWLWRQRTLSTIYTPFGVFKNMAILTINAKQDEDSKYISDFSVTFKRIRIAKKISTYSDKDKQKKAKAAMTMAQQQDKGTNKPSNKSWAKHAKDAGVGQALKDLMSGKVP